MYICECVCVRVSLSNDVTAYVFILEGLVRAEMEIHG